MYSAQRAGTAFPRSAWERGIIGIVGANSFEPTRPQNVNLMTVMRCVGTGNNTGLTEAACGQWIYSNVYLLDTPTLIGFVYARITNKKCGY